MDLVIDANILFSAIIRQGMTSDLLVRTDLRLFAPEFILTEFNKYKAVIKRKSKKSNDEFERLIEIFQRRITLVPEQEFQSFIGKAKSFSPDPKDTPYLALAMRLNCGIWSNDKPLKNGQTKVNVHSTHELIEILSQQ